MRNKQCYKDGEGRRLSEGITSQSAKQKAFTFLCFAEYRYIWFVIVLKAEQCKLTKKTPLDAFGETAITTIYLDKPEFEMLNIFNSVVVTKSRYLLQLGLVVVGLDHYKNGTDELWLAEVEFSTGHAMRDFELPLPYVREVTGISEYDGYALAKRFQQN